MIKNHPLIDFYFNLVYAESMFAIIKTGGKQYLVSPGDKIKIEKIEAPAKVSQRRPASDLGGPASGEKAKEIIFSQVLLLMKNKAVKIGTPLIKGVKVTARVLKQGRAKKVIIFKYKAKKRYQKKIGHRQPYTEVEIIKIQSK